ncbi:MAG: acylphosphatase [Candidatus Marinimicrobia bacterium]|nr:acylphosphatase [Candidatus Neomarinimicrobiota bacterium]
MAHSSDTAKAALALKITGHVHGVGYRYWAVITARRIGLTGWVRNVTDGSVDAVVQGAPKLVEAFVDECWGGPPEARVTSIAVNVVDLLTEITSFEQRATYVSPVQF